MLDLVGQWEESGLSQKAFAAEEGINVHTFQYWITKKRRMADGLDTNRQQGGFLELPTGMNHAICLKYPNGVEIHLPVGTPLALIKGLIAI